MPPISLNIGGTVFMTTLSTLTKYDGMLKAMFESDLKPSSDSPVFIDRDPTHFRKILNFLRDGEIALPDGTEALMEVKKEAEYYCLTELYEMCMDKLFPVKIPPCQKDRFWFHVGGTEVSATTHDVKRHGGLLMEKFLEKEEEWERRTSKWQIYREPLFEIDRDSRFFVYILHFLKTNSLLLAPVNVHRQIKEDALFYGLGSLAEMCDNAIAMANIRNMNMGHSRHH